MLVQTNYSVKLSEEEAIGIKKLLGCIPDTKKTELGLSPETIESLRDFYNQLPDDQQEQ